MRPLRTGSATFAAIVGCCITFSCEQRAVDEHPETVVEAFIERMQAVHGDPERGRRALELLWKEGRDALEERAGRASAAAGRSISPEEMLAPSRFSLRFQPRRLKAESKGNWSRVTVTGDNPTEVAEVHCVKENDRWRVVLDFPKLSPIERRE